MSELGTVVRENRAGAAVIFSIGTIVAAGSYLVIEGIPATPRRVNHAAEIARLSGELPAAEAALAGSQQAYSIRFDGLSHDCQVIVSPYVAEGPLKGTASQEAIDAATDPVCGPNNTGVVDELNKIYDTKTAQQQTVADLEWAIAAHLAALGVKPPTTGA